MNYAWDTLMCVVVLFRRGVIRRGKKKKNKSEFKRFKQELLAGVQTKKNLFIKLFINIS